MQITSVNIGTRQLLKGRSFDGETGIFKEPVDTPVAISPLGLEGDAVLNEKFHGGPDQAVYLYRQEDYDWWSEQLGRRIDPGTFGENLTVDGLPEPHLTVGTHLRFAKVQLEITAPRIPCNTLAQRMNDPRFAKQFTKAERPGLYCRVLVPGRIQRGERFSMIQNEDTDVTTLDMFRVAGSRPDRALLERLLSAPIDMRSRAKYESKLAGLTRA